MVTKKPIRKKGNRYASDNIVIVFLLSIVSIFFLQNSGEAMVDYFTPKRLEMVETQLQPRGIQDPRVLESMRSVPRHFFVPSPLQKRAYEDNPLPIGHDQTISQPYIVALMAQEAKLTSTDIVLEIGTGCGYGAAVLSNLVKKVYSIEFIPELVSEAKKRLSDLGYSNVVVIEGDGSIGLKEYAPFNAIVVTAGAPTVPASLKTQLAIRGRLIIPVGEDTFQKLVRIIRVDKDNYEEEILEAVRFVPLKGKEGWQGK